MRLRPVGGRSSGRARLSARLAGGRIRAIFEGLLRRDRERGHERHFDAFISYSHDRDGRIAVALQHALHRFARPWYRLRALHVFRDDANLTANPNLWSSITAGLRTARYLVLLASPDAASSPWVNREVAHWLEHRPPERILLVLTDGALHWDEEAHDFDWERSDAVPRALSGAFQDEPRYVDMRFARELDPLSMRNPRYREAVADIAAAIHERPKDELIGEDVRQYRRTRRIAWAAGLSLLTLAVAATVAAIVAVRERDRAEEQLGLARSRGLAAEAGAALDRQPSQSLLLSLEALEISDTAEARGALFSGLLERPEIVRFMQPEAGMPTQVAFSPDESTVAAGTTTGSIERWDADTGELLEPLTIGERPVDAIAYSEGGRTLAAADFDGEVHLLDVASGAERSVFTAPDRPGQAPRLAFADGIRTVAAAYSDGVRVWRTGSARPLAVLATPWSDAIELEPRGRMLAVGHSHRVDVWALSPNPRLLARLAIGGQTRVNHIAFSPGGEMLAVGTLTGEVRLWDSRGWTELPSPGELRSQIVDLAFSANGRALAIGTFDRRVRIWDAAHGDWLRGTLMGHIEFVNGLAFASSGLRLASAGGDNNVILWAPRRSDRLARTLTANTTRDQPLLAVDPMGERIAWIARSGDLMLGELDEARPGESISPLGSVRALSAAGPNPTISKLEFSPDGKRLAAGVGRGFSAPRSVEIWDARTGSRVGAPLRVPAEGLDFSPDGRTLATGSFKKLAFSDVATGESQVHSVKDLHGEVLDFSPDGETIAVQMEPGKVAILDAVTLEEDATLRSRRRAFIFDLEFSPDGRILAAGDNDGNVLLWDVAGERLLGPPLTGHRHYVADVEFSPDGTLLASSDSRSRMLLWDVPARRALGSFLIGGTPAFSGDGSFLATTWPGRGIVVRPLDLDSWRELACSYANRNLGAAEWSRFLGSDTEYEPTCPGLPRGRPAEVFASSD